MGIVCENVPVNRTGSGVSAAPTAPPVDVSGFSAYFEFQTTNCGGDRAVEAMGQTVDALVATYLGGSR